MTTVNVPATLLIREIKINLDEGKRIDGYSIRVECDVHPINRYSSDPVRSTVLMPLYNLPDGWLASLVDIVVKKLAGGEVE